MIGRRALLGGAACLAQAGFAARASQPAQSGASPRAPRAALVMNGTISDAGWNQLGYEGLCAAGRAGWHTAYAENVAQADVMAMSRGYAEDGYDLVIGHGFEFASTFCEIAPDFPEARFFVTTGRPDTPISANLAFIDMQYRGIAFGAGVMAALIAPNGRGVGYVGGQDNPTQRQLSQYFQSGARFVAPDIFAGGIVSRDFNNASLGHEAASALIGRGAGVVWHSADVTGLGVLRGVAEHGAVAMGCYTDQSSVAPDVVATSTLLNIPWMIETMAGLVRAGQFPGGGAWTPPLDRLWSMRWHARETNPALVSDQSAARFDALWHRISAGDLQQKP